MSDPAIVGNVEPAPQQKEVEVKDPAIVGSVVPENPEPATPPPPAKPVRQPSVEPLVALTTLLPVLQRIQAQRGRRLFVFATGPIGEETCEEVYRWVAELRAAKAHGVDILIHSPGGILTSCYRIARLIAGNVEEWEALVPSMAASGATLMSLGSSNIVMGTMASLGPIDPQVISKRSEKVFASERQSPLEASEAIRQLREFALSSLNATMAFLLQKQIAPKPALDVASSFAFHLVQPLLSKIEPYDIGSFALDSKLAMHYCERIAKPHDPTKHTQRNANYRKLVEEYPAHEFTIDLEEAKALGFAVSAPDPELEALFDELRPLLDDVETFIGFVPEAEGEAT